MHTLTVGATLKAAWETFKKRPWLFIGVILGLVIISALFSAITEEQPRGAFSMLVSLAVLVINIIIEMGLLAFVLKAHDNVEKVSVNDLWHPKPFWKYVGVKILTGIIVLVGLVLLVVPGIIAAVALIFASYLVIDRNLGPIEAIKESARLTKGHRWPLFFLILAIIGLNILGALAVLVGLVVTVPVSALAVAHAYRTLSKGAAA